MLNEPPAVVSHLPACGEILLSSFANQAKNLPAKPAFASGSKDALLMMALGLAPMGLTYGPLGTLVLELYKRNEGR